MELMRALELDKFYENGPLNWAAADDFQDVKYKMFNNMLAQHEICKILENKLSSEWWHQAEGFIDPKALTDFGEGGGSKTISTIDQVNSNINLYLLNEQRYFNIYGYRASEAHDKVGTFESDFRDFSEVYPDVEKHPLLKISKDSYDGFRQFSLDQADIIGNIRSLHAEMLGEAQMAEVDANLDTAISEIERFWANDS